MSTQIVAYLYFGGNCREAMEFYQASLGGELNLMEVKDTPAGVGGFPAGSEHLIMHAELHKGDLSLMASDMLMGKRNPGNQIELMLGCSSEAELRTFFDALSQGGKVNQPVHTEFWGDTFGQLVDRFGIGWMLNYSKNPPSA